MSNTTPQTDELDTLLDNIFTELSVRLAITRNGMFIEQEKTKQAILDLIKQSNIDLLDRLESKAKYFGHHGEVTKVVPLQALKNEREQ